MTRLNSSHFEFLIDTEGYKGGAQRSVITVAEVQRFCDTMRPIIQCLNWKSKAQQNNVRKMVEVMQRAAENATTECRSDDLPFLI